MRPRRHTRGHWEDVLCIAESGCCCLFVPLFFHFSFSPIFKHYTFSSHFSQELWGLESWNLIHTWTVGSVYRNQAAAAYWSLYFFHSFQFLHIKIFRHTFLRNCEAELLETLYPRGQWANVWYIPESCCCSYSSLYFFIFLSLQFSHIKIFCHIFLRNCETLKVETWYIHGQWADVSCVPESGCCCIFVPLFLHFSFSPIFKY